MSNEAESKSLCPECNRMAAVGTSRGHAIDCRFESKPTNEAEAPPGRLWLPLEAALLLRGDEHDPHEIEYVPASARDAVWEKAIEIANNERLPDDPADSETTHYNHGIGDVVIMLTAARDATLSAGKGATSEEVGQ